MNIYLFVALSSFLCYYLASRTMSIYKEACPDLCDPVHCQARSEERCRPYFESNKNTAAKKRNRKLNRVYFLYNW